MPLYYYATAQIRFQVENVRSVVDVFFKESHLNIYGAMFSPHGSHALTIIIMSYIIQVYGYLFPGRTERLFQHCSKRSRAFRPGRYTSRPGSPACPTFPLRNLLPFSGWLLNHIKQLFDFYICHRHSHPHWQQQIHSVSRPTSIMTFLFHPLQISNFKSIFFLKTYQ